NSHGSNIFTLQTEVKVEADFRCSGPKFRRRREVVTEKRIRCDEESNEKRNRLTIHRSLSPRGTLQGDEACQRNDGDPRSKVAVKRNTRGDSRTIRIEDSPRLHPD